MTIAPSGQDTSQGNARNAEPKHAKHVALSSPIILDAELITKKIAQTVSRKGTSKDELPTKNYYISRCNMALRGNSKR